ncbi:MAG: hypothetical protein Q9207_005185 [Kuettlingeria erythrocarpa]
MAHSPQHSTQKAGKSSLRKLLEPLSKPLDDPSTDASKFHPLGASTNAGDDPSTVLEIGSRPTNLESSLTPPFCARVEKAVRSVMSSSLDPASPHVQMISFFCEWELPAFMRNEFDCHQRISDVVTLVGTMSPYHALATTCSEYIYQNWPDGGPILLAVIQELFESDSKQTSPAQLQVEVAQTLCWLAAAFRSSPLATIARSEVVFEAASLQQVDFVLTLMDLVHLTDTTMCWYSLFTHAPMAVQFPVLPRKEGIGLEISPVLMANLAGTVMVVEFQGGLILKGLSTALIPVKYCNDGAALQWHLYYSEAADGFMTGLNEIEDYLKVQDPAILFQKTAYLGWCKHASVLLGTHHLDYTTVNWSSPAPEQSKVAISGFSLGLASNGLGFFGPSATMNFAIARSQRTRYVDIEQQLEDRLRLSTTKPALLYDTSSQRAWLVPVTCLLLQMMHLRHHQITSRVPSNSTTTMPYADSAGEGGLEAYRILSEHLQPGSAATPLGNNAAWRDTLARLYTGLDMAHKNAEELNKRPWQDMSEIFGFELLDIVLAESPFRFSQRKVQKQSGGWAPIGQKVGYVLFCSGLGDALVPSNRRGNNQNCEHCCRVPPGNDFLSAYVACFRETLARQGEHAGSMLLDDQEYEETLYHDCKGEEKGRCIQLQTYESIIQASKEASIPAPVTFTNGGLRQGHSGAVIIGKTTKLWKRNIPTGNKPTITPKARKNVLSRILFRLS